jgi:hypothetical protein
MTLITPATASEPYIAAPPIFSTSMRSMASSGRASMLVKTTE